MTTESLSIKSLKTLLKPPSASLVIRRQDCAPQHWAATRWSSVMLNFRYRSHSRASSFQSQRPLV